MWFGRQCAYELQILRLTVIQHTIKTFSNLLCYSTHAAGAIHAYASHRMPTPGITILIAAFIMFLTVVVFAYSLCLVRFSPFEEAFDNPSLATTPSKDTGSLRVSKLPSYP